MNHSIHATWIAQAFEFGMLNYNLGVKLYSTEQYDQALRFLKMVRKNNQR